MEASLKIAVVLSAVDKMSKVIHNATTNSQKKLEAFRKATDNTASAAFNIGKSSGRFGLALGAILAGPIKAAAEMEKMNVALKTSFKGNEDAAKKAFKTIEIFAGKTPYNMNEVMKGFIKLKNMGLDPSIEALTAYGNTASAMGKSLNDMVEAVADAATGEFERLKEFGIKASSMKDKVTFTFQGVKTTVKKNSQEIEAYLKKVGLVNFAGGIEEQSKTFYGKLNKMLDSLQMTMAKAGKVFFPVIKGLIDKISPLIDKIGDWIDKNPKLTGTILKWTAGAAALSFTISGLSFAFGGLLKGISFMSSILGGGLKFVRWLADSHKGLGHWIFVSRYRLLQFTGYMKGTAFPAIMSFGNYIAGGFSKAWASLTTGISKGLAVMGKVTATMFRFIGNSIVSVGRILLANPIVLIITGIAAATFLIYKYWDKIKAFFQKLWNGVKSVFSLAWSGIKRMFLNYTPYGLVIKHWEKISGFFKNIWNKAKQPFIDFWAWLKGLGSQFWEAGKNIINSIWNGMKSIINKPVEAVRNMVGKIRKYLPFSPAKEGPLRDIHKIRLIETIAETIKPRTLLDKMHSVTGAVFNVINSPGRTLARPANSINTRAGGVSININSIHLYGKATKEDAATIKRELEKQFKELSKKHEAQRLRIGFM